MHSDAQIARDTARGELSKLEQSVYEAKKERESQLMEYKKQAAEKKEHAEKVEKRVGLFQIFVAWYLYSWLDKIRGRLRGINVNFMEKIVKKKDCRKIKENKLKYSKTAFGSGVHLASKSNNLDNKNAFYLLVVESAMCLPCRLVFL